MKEKALKKNKDALIIILKTLIPYWDLAEGFLEIVQNTEDEDLNDKILDIIYKGVKQIKSTKERNEIKKKVMELHNKYDYEQEKDQKEAENILNDFINNM